jgi:hypothetical protein
MTSLSAPPDRDVRVVLRERAGAHAALRARRPCRSTGHATSEDHSAGTQAPVVRDHAEAGHEAELRVGHRPLAGLSVSWRIVSVMRESRGAAGLAGGELAPLVLFRKVAVEGQRLRAHEVGPCLSQKPRSSNCSITTTG